MKPRKNLSAVVRAALPGVLALGLVALSMGGCDLSTILPASGTDNNGTNSSGNNNPAALAVPAPQPVFTKPTSNLTVPAGAPVDISWFASSDQQTVVSELYRDKDGLKNSGDEVLLTQTSKVAKDYTASTFSWDTTGMTPGTYHLLVVAKDGTNPAVTVYSNYTVTIIDSTPKITVTEPFAPVTVTPAMNVVIKWTEFAPLATAPVVTLYYDNDTNRANGYVAKIATVNEAASSTGDSYVWNVPAIAPGDYYMLAELNYGAGTVFSYSPASIHINGPSLQLLNPSSLVIWHGGGQLAIRYQVTGAKSGSTLRLFYEDSQGLQTTIPGAGAIKITSDQAQNFIWNSGPLPAGSYKIGGSIDDGTNQQGSPPVYAYNGLPVLTDNGPTFSITSPSGPTTIHAGDIVPVAFTYMMNSGTAAVSIYLDNDTTSTNGYSSGVIGQTQISSSSTAGTVNATIPNLPVGTYYIVGVFDNGLTQIVSYAGGGSVVTLAGPQLVLTGPTINGNILPGTTVQITWSNTIPGTHPSVNLFYTLDKVAGPNLPITTGNPNTMNGGSQSYDWTIPADLTGGPWYIGAIVTDDNGNTTPATWAPCAMTMISRNFFVRDLGLTDGTAEQSYADAIGRTFRGFSPNGRLGGITTHVPWKWVTDPKDPLSLRRQPGISTNGDKYDDFIITAPTGNPFYLERVKSGESYLVLSHPDTLFKVPVVGGLKPIVVSAVGSPELPGALFCGPATTSPSTSAGIGSVALSRDADGDGIPEVIFGIPHADKVVYEGQDYDPWDDYEYQIASAAQPATPPGQTQFSVQYADGYREPGVATPINPDGRPTDQTDWRNITAGMLVAVGGKIPAIHAPATRPVGTPELQQIVIPLDSVGEPSIDPHPRVVNGTMTDMRGPDGVRFYCPWWFRSSTPHYAEHTGGPFDSIQTPDDEGYFGDSLIEADLDGDGKPEWISNQPFNAIPATGNNEGWLHVIWSSKSVLWNAPYSPTVAPGAWQNGGRVRVDTITNTTTGSPPVTTTTSTTGTWSAPPPYTWGAWSWPYAFTHGDVVLTMTTDTDVNNNITITWSANDQRERWYCWPVVSDYVQGDAAEAPNGTANAHLGGLANVGDFNGDFREDITVGAPQAAPNGKAGAGVTYLIFGKPSFADHNLNTVGKLVPGALAGIKIQGDNAGDKVGSAQASAGDFNGDGLSDWIIGIPGYSDATGGAKCGAVAIIYGSRYLQGTFKVSDIGTPKLPGVILVGEAANAAAGTYVAGVGDVDGDGYDDVVVIAPGMSWTLPDGTTRTNGGVAYLIYGGPNLTGTISLSQVGKGAIPGMIYVAPHSNEALWTAAPAGDVDNDGYADFLIGNPNYNILDPSGATLSPQVGEVYLIRGGPRLTP